MSSALAPAAKAVIIANPTAAAGDVRRRWSSHERILTECFGAAEVRFTTRAGDATELTRRALRDGATRVIAVGGDGTVNEVVNGFFAEDGEPLGRDAALAIYPAGTGGDLPRSLGLRDRPLGQLMRECSERVVDVGRASFAGRDGARLQRSFLNIASAGASGLVVEKVSSSSKRLGGRAAFMLGTVRGLLAYRNQRVRVRIDEAFEEELLLNTLVVANGRYFGGGMKVAPAARLDDGQLDVVIMGDIGVATFLRYSSKLYEGTHTTLPEIRVFRGRRVVVSPVAGADVLVELDGERAGAAPVTFEVLPSALRLLAPWESAEAATAA